MKRDVFIGVLAAATAILVLSLARPSVKRSAWEPPSQMSLDPDSVGTRPRTAATRPLLLDQVVPEVRFKGAKLTDALQKLRELTGANLVFVDHDPATDDFKPVTLALKNAKLSAIMAAMLDQADADRFVASESDNIIRVGYPTPDFLRDLRVYDIRDLVTAGARLEAALGANRRLVAPVGEYPARDPQVVTAEQAVATDLIGAIGGTVLQNVDNGRFTARYACGCLIVSDASQKEHERIEATLAAIRAELKRTP